MRKPENFVNLALSVAVGVRSHISESICRKGQNRDHYDDDAHNITFFSVLSLAVRKPENFAACSN